MKMEIFIPIGLLALLTYVVYEYRREKQIRLLERTERLHIRFSNLRHRLVLLAGSGQLSRDDQKAFKFLYTATTYLLRHPSLYQRIGTASWVALRAAAPASGSGQRDVLTKQDFSESIYPLLKEYVEVSTGLINEFAHPARLILLAALLSQRHVSEWYKNAGRWIQEFKIEKQRSEAWANLSLTLL